MKPAFADMLGNDALRERLREDIPTALLYAAALTSLKMETPGPFAGTRRDVDAYIERFYTR